MNTNLELIDTHCHVSCGDFGADRGDVLNRAGEAGVRGILTVATAPEEWRRYLDLSEGHLEQRVALGFHPNYADTYSPEAAIQLRELALANAGKVVAVGETGLDYFRDHCSPAIQEEAFQVQLDMAVELNLPFILHCRAAEKEMCDMLTRQRDKLGQPLCGVWHCFTATVEYAKVAVELGLHLAFGGVLTYPKAEEVRAAARWAPKDRILIETDAPYLPPQPWRGKRNEPAYMLETAKRLAEVRGIALEDCARLTSENARGLFNCW